MSATFYRSLSTIFGLMLIGVVFGSAFFAATIGIKDLDLWLHMRMGQYIVEHMTVPATDVLSASAWGLPWNNHEWLFQVVVHLVRDSFGMDGLLYMQAILVVITGLIFLVLTYHRDRQLAVAGLLYLVFEIFQSRFTVRPDMFSFLFYAAFIYVLAAHLQSRWSLLVLFVIQALWVNMHGFFFMGLLFIVIALVSEGIKRSVPLPWEWNKEGRLTDEEFRRLGLALLVVCAASLLNPQGIKGALYPFDILRQIFGESRIFLAHITELARPITADNVFDYEHQWPLKSLILVTFISFILNRRKIDLSALFLWLFFLAFGLSALRNMVYLAFASYLAVMMNISNLSLTALVPFKAADQRFVFMTGILVRILLSAWFLNRAMDMSAIAYYDFTNYERKSSFLGVDERAYPKQAADFLVRNNIKGNFFNDFNSGAYLIGRVYPNIMVYMDGRTELRGPAFFKKYRRIWDDGNARLFDEAVAAYGLSGVFVNTTSSAAPENFLKMIAARPEWKPVYFDHDAVIFLKDIPRNADLIARFGIDFSSIEPGKIDIRRLGPMRALPYQLVGRGMSLFAMGYLDQALAEADALLKILPDAAGGHKIRSLVFDRRNNYEQLFDSARLAVVYAPGDLRQRSRLSYAYLMLGDEKRALKEADKLVERAPKSGWGEVAKAKVFVKKKQFSKGYDILLAALGKTLRISREAMIVGDIAYNDGEFFQAQKIYRLIARKDKRNAEALDKLGDSLAALGRKPQAVIQWKKALLLKSGDEDIRKKISGAEK